MTLIKKAIKYAAIGTMLYFAFRGCVSELNGKELKKHYIEKSKIEETINKEYNKNEYNRIGEKIRDMDL
ncbi:hypothetical protein JW949_00455 [Candidatus Woesearchaeota archaeon]|nr:hypothetical protein [Candidatus Woesearchaeota archaeon]